MAEYFLHYNPIFWDLVNMRNNPALGVNVDGAYTESHAH